MRTFIKWVENVLLCILIVLAVISASSFLNSKKNPKYIPGIGPYKFMAVLSGSMSPTFNVYDLIIDKTTNIDDLKAGDVITFRESNLLVTHRISKVENKAGKKSFITRGDANNIEDQAVVMPEQVQAKYIFKIPYMGFVLSKMRGPIGVAIIWGIFFYFTLMELIPEFTKKTESEKVTDTKEGAFVKGNLSHFKKSISSVHSDVNLKSKS